MTEIFKVSVIIPVYNAELYVENAVLSALDCEETGEVILIEDDSPDNSIEICRRLESTHENVRLLKHADQKNHGAGRSRNLGIAHARCPYVAFLDADDYYLPNRFETSKQVFERNPEADAVYEAYGKIGITLEGVDDYNQRYKKNLKYNKAEVVRPSADFSEPFFYYVLSKQMVFWHTNSITYRKSSIQQSGLLFEDLKLHQDSFFWLKSAYYLKLLPGNIKEAVAHRTYHGNNRETRKDFNSISNYEKAVFEWGKTLKGLSLREKWRFIKRYSIYYPGRKYYNSPSLLKWPELLVIGASLSIKFITH